MGKKLDEKIQRIQSSGNVFADLGIENPDKYLAKAKLAQQINKIIEHKGWKQAKAAEILEIDQPKVSALSCGHLDDFSIERLIGFLNKLDRDVQIVVKKRPTRRKDHGHLSVAFS